MRIGLLLFLASVCFSAISAAQPAAGDAWLQPPYDFMISHVVRSTAEPAKAYDVILDVPPSRSAKAARPQVTKSCGDGLIDGIAWDYVKLTLRQNANLAAMNKDKELRFSIRLLPPALRLVDQASAHDARSPIGGFRTPRPFYPYSARVRHEEGECRLRVRFAHGKAALVVVAKSTGSGTLDADAALTALSSWSASGPEAENATTTVPVTFVLHKW